MWQVCDTTTPQENENKIKHHSDTTLNENVCPGIIKQTILLHSVGERFKKKIFRIQSVNLTMKLNYERMYSLCDRIMLI